MYEIKHITVIGNDKYPYDFAIYEGQEWENQSALFLIVEKTRTGYLPIKIGLTNSFPGICVKHPIENPLSYAVIWNVTDKKEFNRVKAEIMLSDNLYLKIEDLGEINL